MSKTVIELNENAREKLHAGITKLSTAVKTTMGPAGRLVLIKYPNQTLHLTKDGVTVAKHIKLEEPTEILGASMILQAAEKVVSQAGDGTTSVTTFASNLVDLGMEGVKRGINPVGIKKGLQRAASDAIELIPSLSDQLTDTSDLISIATISANGDVAIGQSIANAIEEVGTDGVVMIEESRNGITKSDLIEGMEFAKGMVAPVFATNEGKMVSQMTKVNVLIINAMLSEVSKEFTDILNYTITQGRSLLIIAENFSDHVMSTLVMNKARGVISVNAVKAPEFGDRRTHVLKDIATLTGATVIDKLTNKTFKNFEPSWLGTAEKVTSSRDTTVIVNGGGSPEAIVERANHIKEQIDVSESPYDIEHLQQRLTRLVGVVAVITVGGINESDMLERKDRFEDALNATKSAMEEGVVPGGGVSYLHLRKMMKMPKNLTSSEQYGYQMVLDSLPIFFKTILRNAGHSEEEIQSGMLNINRLSNTWKGIDVESKKLVDFKELGIIDPAKVIRCVIEAGTSVAANILLVEATITQTDTKTGQEQLFEQ